MEAQILGPALTPEKSEEEEEGRERRNKEQDDECISLSLLLSAFGLLLLLSLRADEKNKLHSF